MGQLHNELTGRAGFLARAIRNALQIENADTGIERLSETLTPTVNLWERPEWALLRGERLWGVAPSQAAVVAEFSQVGIFNPANSGLIVVVKEVGVFNNANAFFDVILGANVPFSATSTPNSRDSRTALIAGIHCGSFAHHAAARIGAGAIVWSFGNSANTYTRYVLDIVLSPGFFLAIGPPTVNQAAQVSLLGYERPAFSGELTARA